MLRPLHWLPPLSLAAASVFAQPTVSDYAILFSTQDESPRVRFVEGQPTVTYFSPNRDLAVWTPDTGEPATVTDGAGGRASFNGLFVTDSQPQIVWRDTRASADGSERVLLTRRADGIARLDTGGAAFHPVVAESPGTLALAWTDERAGNAAYQMWFNRLHDGAWLETDVRIDTGEAPAYDPMVAANDQVIVAGWSMPTLGHAIHLRHSADGGQQWSAPTSIVPDGEPLTPMLLATGDAWRLIYYLRDAGIVVHRSKDGVAWEAPEPIPGTAETGSIGFRADQAGERLCLGWTGPLDRPAQASDIYAVCSADQGLHWTPVSRLDTDPVGAAASLTPAIAVDEAGRIIVAWQDLRQWRPAIRFNASLDGGLTWHAQDRPLRTTVGAHDQLPAIDDDGQGRFMLVWSHAEGDNPTARKHRLAFADLRLDCGKDSDAHGPCSTAANPPAASPLPTEARLRERAQAFWDHYLTGDFASGYALFDPFFRAQVTEGVFLSRLAPLDYLSADIVAIRTDPTGRRAEVTMSIGFKADAIALGIQSGTIAPTTREIVEPWIAIDGDWYKLYRSQAGDFLPRF